MREGQLWVGGVSTGLGRGVVGRAGGAGLGDMEAPGWGVCCYQLSFQQDAFEGGEEGLVHSEALEPCSCPLFRGPVPAIQSTEHALGAHGHNASLPAAQEGKQEDEKLAGWGSRQEKEGRARNLEVKRAGRGGVLGEGGHKRGLPRWAFTRLPRVALLVPAPAPRRHMGRGGATEEGPTLSLLREGRRGYRNRSTEIGLS